mmetsp:Transcript_58063/g.186554  ORF Transcript_58063/g.186554 Transcript_58063/m.186554 type:complete len:490 (-) Transcript_58063:717-2186(-)
MRIEAIQVAIRCAFPVHAQQDALGEAGNTSTAFAVANIGLGGGDGDRLSSRVLGHDLPVSTDLDRISQGGAGAMALGGVDLARVDADLFDHCLVAPLLRRPVRRSQRRTSAILVDLAPRQQGEVAALLVVVLQLEARGSSSLASRIPVCRHVVREAASQMRVHSRAATANVREGAHAQVHTANDDSFDCVVHVVQQVQLPRVRAHQGCRAGCVDRHTRALEIHAVVDAVRRDGVGAVGGTEAAAYVLGDRVPLVLVEAHKRSNVGWLRLQLLLGPASTLQRYVRDLQDLPLRGVHAFGLSRRDVKEAAVEELDAVRESAVAGVGQPASLVCIRGVVDVAVPALEGVPDHGVPTCFGVGYPQLPGLIHAEGVALGERSDGHLLYVGHRRSGEPAHAEGQVARDVGDDVLPRLVEVPGRNHQRLAVWLVVELVPVCGEDRQHARLHGDASLHIACKLGDHGQLRSAWACVDNDLQLRAPHHRQEARCILVL